MVRQSRAVKRMYEGRGTGRGEEDAGPNMRAKDWSLKRQSPIFALDEARNLEGPEVTREAGLLVSVEVRVSRVLAVR